ncbi:MAG: hypothetical protein ACXVHO_10220, partial [Methanobacterium sp.]
LSGKNIGFRVTPKKQTGSLSLLSFFPHLIIFFMLTMSIYVGIGELFSGNFLNANVILWAIYNTFLLLFFIYFYWEDIKKGKSLKNRKD